MRGDPGSSMAVSSIGVGDVGDRVLVRTFFFLLIFFLIIIIALLISSFLHTN